MCPPADASPTILANACARLGADGVRSPFIAADLHHLLLAGLPAHSHIILARGADGAGTASAESRACIAFHMARSCASNSLMDPVTTIFWRQVTPSPVSIGFGRLRSRRTRR